MVWCSSSEMSRRSRADHGFKNSDHGWDHSKEKIYSTLSWQDPDPVLKKSLRVPRLTGRADSA